ncbi:MAG: cytochrome P450 [Gammaproteobacteria bacterium]|nr:cytochrome P450 [Gammaproteobacteria bacterium]
MAKRDFPYDRPEQIDFMDPVVQENWFEAYDLIREESPAYYMSQIGMYVLTRYDDIEYVLRNRDKFTSSRDTEPLIKYEESLSLYKEKGWPRIQPLSLDIPKHSHFRKLVDPALTAGEVKKREPFIRGIINELIDSWIDKEEIEFIEEFAEPLPMIVIAELLGFPRMDLPQLKVWSAAWVLPHSRGLSLEQETESVEKHIELQHYIFDAIKQKRKNPKKDIITHLTQTEVYDVDIGKYRPLKDEEIIGSVDHLLIGGNETTTFAISNGLWLLFQNYETYKEIETNSALIKNFVEETLRIESPTQGLFRSVKEDCNIGGVDIPAGSTLSIRYGAGNRDPRRYECPMEPDLKRKNAGRHLAFGIGEHVCPGATLSRYEQRWAWEILLARLRNIRPTPGKNDYTHMKGMWLRALNKIYVSFEKTH